MEVEHVSDAVVRERRSECRDVVLFSLVEDAPLVVDLLPEARNELKGGDGERLGGRVVLGRPVGSRHEMPSLLRPLPVLLVVHHRYQRRHSVLKLAVVLVWDEQVPYAVDPLLPQLPTGQLEVAHVGVIESLDGVLLDALRGPHDDVHHPVPDQEPDDLALPAGDLVGGVGEE